MFYYTSNQLATPTNSSASANTDALLMTWYTKAAYVKAYIQKLISSAPFTTPADTAIWNRLATPSAGTASAGTAYVPRPNDPASPAALVTASSLPINTGPTWALPMVSLAHNMRGTAMWAAFVPDEAKVIYSTATPSASTTSTGNMYLINQTSGTSAIPIHFQVEHSE